MSAIAMIDSPLACPLAELATQGVVPVGVGHWVSAFVESSDLHYAHLDLSRMGGGVICVAV